MKRWCLWLALIHMQIQVGLAQPALQLTGAKIEGQPTTVWVQNGNIVAAGSASGTETHRVDLSGLYLYPGLVESDSVLGLIEIDSVRGTDDIREVGDNNADLRPELAVNPDSELLPVARSGGVLSAALLPHGGRISGQVGVISLFGWSNSEMQLSPSPGVVVEWPRFGDDDLAQARQDWRDRLAQLSDWLEEAEAWGRATHWSRPVHPEFEPLCRVDRGEGKLFIRAQDRFQIESALEFCQKRKLRWVLVGGAEADTVAEALARERVDVIYTEVYRLPDRDFVDYDHYYRVPARLKAAGVRVALAGPSSHDNARWLPQMAALCWAHGWSEQEAIESITSAPCEILGLEHQGKIAPGQRATLIATDRPLLDPRARVVRAWIGGQEIDLSDRQKRLYEKYRNKPRLDSHSSRRE